jgi:hypothetical protein
VKGDAGKSARILTALSVYAGSNIDLDHTIGKPCSEDDESRPVSACPGKLARLLFCSKRQLECGPAEPFAIGVGYVLARDWLELRATNRIRKPCATGQDN